MTLSILPSEKQWRPKRLDAVLFFHHTGWVCRSPISLHSPVWNTLSDQGSKISPSNSNMSFSKNSSKPCVSKPLIEKSHGRDVAALWSRLPPPRLPLLSSSTIPPLAPVFESRIFWCFCRQRMKAMEHQIASLTGLVQHALLKGSNASGASKEPPR